MLVTLLLATLIAVVQAQYPLQLVYQFPNTSYVNIENVAVRSSNGQLLLNIATGPRLIQLDPANPVPEDLITLSGPDSLTGIAETAPDVFTVAAGNFSFGPQVPGGVAGIPGTFGVWSIDLNGPQAVARQIVAIPEANSLNGLATVSCKPDHVYIADSGLGAIWSVNIKTGQYEVAIQDAAFAPTADFSLGINGLKGRKNVLYWTNSAQGTYGSIEVGSKRHSLGPVVQIAQAPEGYNFDDFALDRKANAYLATAPNAVYEATQSGAVLPIAMSDDIVSPTSAVLKGSVLYVVTGGSANPAALTSGQVFAIDLGSA